MDRPELSLCMIVRDEAAMLPDFLIAVAGLWDEFIAVDTGSTDSSVNLLVSSGAKVFHFPWVDDFSAARNASLERATGRWILFLDADERVDDPLKAAIKALLADPLAGAATVTMRNELPGGHRRDSRLLRLFRNDPLIRFRYRIHEDISAGVQGFLQRENLQVRHLNGVVRHLGYTREVAAARDKKERDLELLRTSLAQDPDDYYCRYKILEIARFWDDGALWRSEAASCADLLANLTAPQAGEMKLRNWSGELAALVCQGLALNPAFDKAGALEWLRKSAPWSAESAAWWLRQAALLEEIGRLDEAKAAYRKCLAIDNEAASQLVSVRPLLGLCRLALVRGDLDEATRLARRAAQEAPLDAEALLSVAACAKLGKQSGATTGLVDEHLAQHPEAALPLARACLGSALVTAARDILLPRAESDPEAALGLLVCGLVLGDEFHQELDLSKERADALLRDWIHCLWQSRDSWSLGAFADNCPAVTGVFPWLPDFLASETGRLSGR